MSAEKWRVLQWAGRMVKYATLCGLSERFGFAYVDPPQMSEDEKGTPQEELAKQQRVRIMGHFGFRSSPVVKGGECIVVAPRGGTTNAVALASDNLSYGPTDLKEGEVAIFSAADTQTAVCRIKLDKDGNIILIPKSGAKVKLGDDTDANLDPLALFSRLQIDFNNFVNRYNAHQHLAGTLSAPMGGGTVTGATATTLSNAQQLSNSVASSNVVAKK